MGEMFLKVHAKDSFTLVRLISIKSVYTKIRQLLQSCKPDKNNISWLSNRLIVSFSGSESCNPNLVTWRTESLTCFDNYSGQDKKFVTVTSSP